LQAYETATSEYQCPFFRLHEPDVDLLRSLLRTLGPGGIPLTLAAQQAEFGLDTSDSSPNAYPNANVHGLIFRAHEIERMLSTVGTEAGSVHTMPICFDTGASGGLTPFKSDFIDYTPLHMSVSGVGGEGKVIGVGTTLTRVTCRDGTTAYVTEVKYHSTSINIRLSSPQNLTGTNGQALLKDNKIAWTLSDGRIVDIPIDHATNLPLIKGSFVCTAAEKEKFKSTYVSYSEPITINVPTLNNEDKFESESNIAARCYNCVTDKDNTNITGPAKELLHWHHRICLNMKDTQDLMKPQVIYDQSGKMIGTAPPVIPTVYKSTKNIKPADYPCCQACKLATAKTRSTGTSTSKPVASKEGILSRDKYEPGDMISSDQYVVNTPGRLESGFGRDAHQNCYHGGTIYQDAASNLVRVQNQVSLGAGETVMGKTAFEDWIWDLAGVLAKQYHSDNGIFASQHYRDDCIDKRQKQTFSGVGAKHQNARAERTIQTISYWARHMMVHTALHWPADGADNIRLWAFAVTHAAWLYNRLPNKSLGMKSPLEVFTKSKSDHRDLLRTHVWGCPAFVLEAKLQDGKKIPKFNRRARMGQFLGFSDEHSTLVGRVRNLSTNFVSPQFHVVYDDKFSSIYNALRRDDLELEAIFADLFQFSREYYGEDAVEEEICESANQGTEGAPVGTPTIDNQPELNDEWLTENEIRQKRDRIERHRNALNEFQEQQAREFEKLNSTYKPSYPVPDGIVTDDESSDSDSSDDESVDPRLDHSRAQASEGASDTPAAEAAPVPRRNPR
jgi:transposase InsO family protein